MGWLELYLDDTSRPASKNMATTFTHDIPVILHDGNRERSYRNDHPEFWLCSKASRIVIQSLAFEWLETAEADRQRLEHVQSFLSWHKASGQQARVAKTVEHRNLLVSEVVKDDCDVDYTLKKRHAYTGGCYYEVIVVTTLVWKGANTRQKKRICHKQMVHLHSRYDGVDEDALKALQNFAWQSETELIDMDNQSFLSVSKMTCQWTSANNIDLTLSDDMYSTRTVPSSVHDLPESSDRYGEQIPGM